jgi:hypothetical protein
MEEKRKTERPRKRWREEIQDNLNIMGIKTGNQWSETFGNGGRLYWQARHSVDSNIVRH